MTQVIAHRRGRHPAGARLIQVNTPPAAPPYIHGTPLVAGRSRLGVEQVNMCEAGPSYASRPTPEAQAGDHPALPAAELRRRLQETQARLDALIGGSSDLIALIAADGTLSFVSPSIGRLLGFTPAEVVGKAWLELQHPEDAAESAAKLRGLLQKPGMTTRRKGRLRHRDGSWRVFEISATNPAGTRGIDGIVVNCQDVTRSELSDKRYRAIFDNAGEAMFVTDGSFLIRHVNAACATFSGYTPEEVVGRHLVEFVPEEYGRRAYAVLEKIRHHGSLKFTFPFRRKSGEARLAQVSAAAVSETEYAFIWRDITDKRRAEERIHKLAYFDALTGLANNTSFVQALNEACRRGPLCLLRLSIENFREISDTVGHLNADELLRQTAQRLRSALPADATLARTGTAQFGMLVFGCTSRDDGVAAAYRALEAFEIPLRIGSLPVTPRLAIGCARAPEDAAEPQELLRRANVAMTQAGACKRGLHLYSPAIDRYDPDKLALIAELKQALGSSELEVWYQPKLSLRTDALDSVEALVRWRHPRRGMVPPDDFIPAAERTGLIDQLTYRILETAIADAAAWRKRGLQIDVAVNVSPLTLVHGSFQTTVLKALQFAGLPPSSLILEVTEGALVEEVRAVKTVLGELRDHGVRVALDDFGTGHSSFAQLASLPIDELKLDKSFIGGPFDTRAAAVTRAALHVGRELGLKVTCEGVESENSLRLLRQMGCDCVQGFHISKAMPAADFLDWLSRR